MRSLAIMNLNRRNVMGGLVLGLAASGPAYATAAAFHHGVASGDPALDGMILWTRIGDVAGRIAGRWSIAEDPNLKQLVAEGDFTTGPERDWTVKVEAVGLRPGRDYWYQFETMGVTSPIGRARTLPDGPLEQLDLVVACCAMYAAGHFYAYREIARRERLDAVLFLGDYIYEYGVESLPTAPFRLPEPRQDTITLDDYRRRYAQTRRDLDLQAAHARAPWICTWDDHEFANDDWREGAQHHAPHRDGDWRARKAAAARAYLEWMPIRDPPSSSPCEIQRAFAFGDLATLIVPETRLSARDRPLTLGDDLDELYVDVSDPARPVVLSDPALVELLRGGPLPPGVERRPDMDGFREKLSDPGRHMVGGPQLGWIRQEMEAAVERGRTWVLFGSATVMAHYDYPDLTPWTAARDPLTQAKFKPFESYYQASRLQGPLLNLDSWDGYAAEREKIYDIIEQTGARTVVLSGDSHMAWLNELHRDGRLVAVEASTSTLTGPSIGALFGLQAAPMGAVLAERNADVRWCDHRAVGFVAVTITHSALTAQFMAITDPTGPRYEVGMALKARTTAYASGSSAWEID